jgi:tetratricopeptide (TPR) repeat protein
VFRNRDAAVYVPSLEGKLAANPKSPSFARLASYYLKEGKTQEAIDICLEGLKTFPQYATAHLVLGRCYETLGRNIEAMLEYRRALKAVPDNATVKGLLETVERREQEAFQAFAEERAKTLEDKKDSLTFEEYIASDSSEKESTADFLLKRLQDVKQQLASPTPRDSNFAQEPRPAGSSSTTTIVTATLAEIYANQGEYKEAIEAYRKLLDQRPVEAERYEKRIAQLEELTKLQQTDHR